jgi:hypothetical protein
MREDHEAQAIEEIVMTNQEDDPRTAIPRALKTFLAIVLALSPALPGRACPVMLVSGSGRAGAIDLTFRNRDKLPIRRLEFTCRIANAPAKAALVPCYEPNASFLPGGQYTLTYGVPGGRGPVVVSVKSAMFADGRTWKPSKHDPCRVLKIPLPRAK